MYSIKLNSTLEKAKFEHFNNSESYDQKLFWRNCKPYLTNKHNTDTNIVLNEQGELLLKNEKIANTFNSYFGSIVKNKIGLHEWAG